MRARPSNGRHFPIVALLFICVSVVTACAVNPVTGKRQLMLITVGQEASLGAESDVGIVAAYGLYDDEALSSHITMMGEQMARNSHRPDLDWSFKVLDSPVINAFAVPGGYVYVTRGILPYLGSEAELAGILGHEIGHITARHSAQRLSQAQLAQLGLGIGAAFSERFRKYSAVAEAGVGLLMLSFSRENEREADRLGVEYATSQGWAAGEMANFFATLERMHPSTGDGLPDWFSTHPAPEKRVETVRQLAEEWRAKVEHTSFDVNREEYLRKINGIIFGADPRQGFVRDGWFNHPELTLRFPLPDEWSVLNETSQVQITAPEKEAVILFSLGTTSSPSAEADSFFSGLGVMPVESERVTVNGFPARRSRTVIETDQGAFGILSTFIMKGSTIFTFHGICDLASFDAFRSDFEHTMNGFSLLTDRALLSVQPDRIRIVRGEREETLRTFLLSRGVPEERLEEFSLLNGKRLDDRVTEGEPIKIVEPDGGRTRTE